MKKLLFLVPVLLFSISCIRVNENPIPQINLPISAEKEGLFIHVSSGIEDEHKVLMALAMANTFAESHDVLMYFDIDGIDMVQKDSPNLEMQPFGSSDELIEKLINKGVTLFACPSCMKVAGVTPSDLRSGFTVADKEEFFDFTDGRILSIDY